MNKKSVVLETIFVFLLTLIILIVSFSTSFVLSNNEAKSTLISYADSVTLSLNNGDSEEEIVNKYSSILNLRITVFNKEANVLIEINNDDKNAASENRLNELISNANNFYYKDSLTLGYSVLYYVKENSNNFVRVGIPRSNVEKTSLNILIYGSVVVILIDAGYGFIKYRRYKKSLNRLKDSVEELENIVGVNYDLSNDDGYKIIDTTLSKTSLLIKDQVDRLKSEKDKTDYILDSIEEGFIVLSGDKKCLLINKFALDKLGVKKENVIGNSFHSLALGDELNNQLLQAFQKNSSTFDKTIGSEIYQFLLTKIDLKWINRDGQSGIGIVFFNVTQERLNEKIRREFFQNASHELKTPLTTIIGYEEMIDSGILDEKEEIDKARKAVIKESKRMQSVIEDMLALSSLEYKMSNEEKVEIDAKSGIKDIVSSLEYMIDEKEIDCKCRLSDVTLKMIPKDFDRLVRNLLSNAIKYNKEKGKIFVYLTKDELMIKDTGIGIEEKYLGRIFERFFRVDKGRSREQGGTGLGLAIVKHICLNYGYKIEVKSNLAEGTTFLIKFK